ncbi:MAG TPA: pilin [Patescibacteria group bacterium]|nr:pilin [Patescibacteria group bacterium]
MATIQTTSLQGCYKDGVATLACIPVVIQNVINFLVMFAGIVCVFLIVYAGIRLVMSEGDPEKISTARKTLIYAIFGLVIVIMSFFILGLVSGLTGVSRIAPK